MEQGIEGVRESKPYVKLIGIIVGDVLALALALGFGLGMGLGSELCSEVVLDRMEGISGEF